MEWFLKAFKNFSFNGRARRKEYWMFSLIVSLIALVLGFLDGMLDIMPIIADIGLLGGIFILAIFVQSIAVTVRRLHDTGRSGWWFLIAFIPFIGSIILLVMLVLDSQPDTNEYGPSPKQAT